VIRSYTVSSERRGRAWSPSLTLLLLIAVIGGAWAFSVWAELSGAAFALHHHTLYHDVANHGLPPWAAVYQQVQRWLAAECFTDVAGDLRAVLRMAGDREPEPSAVVLDSRTLRSSPESRWKSTPRELQ